MHWNVGACWPKTENQDWVRNRKVTGKVVADDSDDP